MILTSNQSFGSWGDVFGDRVIATAILDRVLHHSVTINIKGNSYRLKEKMKAGLIRADGPKINNQSRDFSIATSGEFELPLTYRGRPRSRGIVPHRAVRQSLA